MCGHVNDPSWSVETNESHGPRCQGSLHMLLRVPPDLARWQAGSLGEGTTRLVSLCPRCDSNEPSAQGLLAFFAVHPAVDDSNVAAFASLVNEWIHNLPIARNANPVA